MTRWYSNPNKNNFNIESEVKGVRRNCCMAHALAFRAGHLVARRAAMAVSPDSRSSRRKSESPLLPSREFDGI